MTASKDTKAAQVGGTHYSDTAARCPHCDGEIQHWDLYSNAPGLVYSATKHITRHRQKGGKQDLLKAITEIQKIIEQEYPEKKPEEIMRDEWAGTRGGAAHAESAHHDLLPLDNSPEAVLARANAFATAHPDDDVPLGWAIRKFTGVGNDEEYWRFRRCRGGDTRWSDKYTTRSEVLAMLTKRVDENRLS